MQATKSIRESLRESDKATCNHLQAVLDIFSCETVSGNSRRARAFLKLLNGLVNQCGGITSLEVSLREEILSCDCYFSLRYATRPLFPAKDWAIGKLDAPWTSQIERMDPCVYQSKRSPSALVADFPTLRLVLDALQELFTVHAGLLHCYLPQDAQLLQWYRIRKLYCVSRLADHYVDITLYPYQLSFPSVEAYCTIAAVLLANMVLGCPEPINLGVTLMKTLRRLLDNGANGQEQPRHRNLRLWAVYVGSLAERVHAPSWPGSVQLGFQAELASMSCVEGSDDWPVLEQVLRQVLYDDDLQQEVQCGTPCRTLDLVHGLYTTCGLSWRLPFSASAARPFGGMR